MLLEPFHRWAAAQGVGVLVEGRRVASVSFADDLALVGRTREEIVVLAAAYLRWCDLLGLKVTKVQTWSSKGPGKVIKVGPLETRTALSFKILGRE